MIYFGVDPGKSGSISAIWDDDGQPEPSMARHDWAELKIVEWVRQFDLTDARVMIEKVHASPPQRGKQRKSGTASMFTFGEQFGFCKGIFTALLDVPYMLVTPQCWQKVMGCRAAVPNMTQAEKKNLSKAAAERLWPTINITHRNADSLLIAAYGRQYWAN